MSTCPKCGAQANSDAKFCQICGTAIVQAPVAEQPAVAPAQEPLAPQWEQPVAVPVQEEPVAAPVQDEPVAAPVQEEPVAAPVQEEPVVTPKAKKKKKFPILPIILGVGGVLLVAIIAIAILVGSIFFRKEKEPTYTLYLKDGELFYNSLKKDSKSWQVTNKLFETDDFTDKEMASLGSAVGRYTYMSENGKYIFYIDKMEKSSEGVNLYYREVENDKAEPVKIDSGVSNFSVNKDATLVTYTKGEDNDLYQYTVKKDSKEKIASETEEFITSEDGKTIYYTNNEGSVYMKVAGKDKEKLASEVDSLEYFSLEKKTFYYLKENNLYKQVVGKDKEKILSNVHEILKIYESGEIYYTTGETTEVPLMNYVTDDLKESDAAMVEPTYPNYPDYPTYPSYPDYPYSWNYDTYAEYQLALEKYNQEYDEYEKECDRLLQEYNQARDNYDKAVTEYNIASDAYYAKQNRDAMRQALGEEKVSERNYSLYYFDGKKDTLISESIYYYGYDASSSYTTVSTASEAAVIAYEVAKKSETKTIKMSEIQDIYSVKNMVTEAMQSDTELHIAAKEKDSVLKADKEIHCFRINEEGTLIYYIDNVEDEKNYGTLYRISISKDKVGKAEVYDNDVYYGYVSLHDDNKVTYFKDVKAIENKNTESYYVYYKGELYIDKTRVDSDVLTSSITYDKDHGMLYYTDYNIEKECGTLKLYKDNKSVKIGDDVHARIFLPDGRILFLSDFSMKNYKGELSVWSKDKAKKIDDDVSTLIPIKSTSDLYAMYY